MLALVFAKTRFEGLIAIGCFYDPAVSIMPIYVRVAYLVVKSAPGGRFEASTVVQPLTAKIVQGSSRFPAGFRSRLSRGWWLSPSCSSRFCRFGCDRFSRLCHGRLSRFSHSGLFRFDHDFNWNRQFRLGRFSSAMVALVQRLDAGSFFVGPELSVFTASAFVLEVFRNRFRGHGRSVAEPSSSKLSNCDHSMTI